MPTKKPEPGRRLYFIAWVLPEPLQSEITDFKELADELFYSRHALKSPAHITFIPPFYASEEEVDDLTGSLTELLKRENPIWVEFNGFDKFGRRVIFVNVTENPALVKFQKRLYNWFKQNYQGKLKPNRFHPHATVAFRDLQEEFFDDAWSFFSQMDYEDRAVMNEIHILKHENKKWRVIKRLPLTGKNKEE